MDQNIILNQLKLFFPHSNYTIDNLEQFIETDELNIQKDSIANTLKGALLDENIVEVQLQDLDEIFFCRILDNPYDITKADSESGQSLKILKYEKGSYLDVYDHLIITPLEPSMGNYLITSYQKSKVLLKVVSHGNAIELGCFFDQRTVLGDMPVLRLTFPFIRKKTTGAREFRAKVPKAMQLQVTVERARRTPVITSPINISLNGMSLLDPMGRHTNLKVGEKVLCDLQIPNEDPVLVEASIIHVTRLRNLNGLQHCFGVQFNFSKPATKSSIEKIVSLVQRKHLRELSEIEEKYGIFYDKR
jgi:hypothetical protein